ncbi:MAG: hypothetical protein COB67_09895, partial [SAR324 cluster bacterium]
MKIQMIQRGFMARQLIFLLLFVLILGGCASTATDYQKAKTTNTIIAYQRFIRKNLDSPEAKQAQIRIKRMQAAAIKKKAKQEDNVYFTAKKAGSTKAWERFLIDHRENRHWDEAQQALKRMKGDKKDSKRFAQLQKKYPVKKGIGQYDENLRQAIQGHETFIRKYARNLYLPEVKKTLIFLKKLKRENQEFSAYNLKNTVEGYTEFIKKYPSNRFVYRAKIRRDTFLYQSIREVDTIKAYTSFLQEYPKNSNRDLVLRRRDFLVERKKTIKNLKTVVIDKNIDSMQGHQARVSSLSIGGKYLVSGSYDRTIKVWQLKTGELLHTLSGHQDRVLAVATNGRQIASGSYDGTVRIWDLQEGKELKKYDAHQAAVSAVTFDGDLVISASHDGRIIFWDGKGTTLKAHQDAISSLVTSEKYLISGSRDGTIKVWDKKSLKLVKTLKRHEDSVTSLAINDQYLVSGAYDKQINLWKVNDGFRFSKSLTGHEDAVLAVAIDNNLVVSGSYDKTVRIWDLEKQGNPKIIQGHFRPVYSIALQGSTIVSGSQDHRINAWQNREYEKPFQAIQEITKNLLVDYVNVVEQVPPEVSKPTLNSK